MKTKRTMLRLIAGLAITGAVVAGCGGGSEGSRLCKDYAELNTLSGTDQATLERAAELYRKLADEAPASVQDDLRVVADAEESVAEGRAFTVDDRAVSAAAERADVAIAATCGVK